MFLIVYTYVHKKIILFESESFHSEGVLQGSSIMSSEQVTSYIQQVSQICS